jgi:hypothetical protein
MASSYGPNKVRVVLSLKTETQTISEALFPFNKNYIVKNVRYVP